MGGHHSRTIGGVVLHPDGCQDYFWNIESGRVKATPVSDGRTIKGYADLVADNGDRQLRQYERERERKAWDVRTEEQASRGGSENVRLSRA